jgi:hypothetical protein
VQILGNGAGAEAYCTIGDNNQVAAIVVTNGGSGYLPLQFNNTVFATVLLTNGKVENLQYR